MTNKYWQHTGHFYNPKTNEAMRKHGHSFWGFHADYKDASGMSYRIYGDFMEYNPKLSLGKENYQKITLGKDALPYFPYRLKEGNKIARILLKNYDLFKGKVYTYSPRGYQKKDIEKKDFEGPLSKMSKPYKKHRDQNKETTTGTIMIPIFSTDDILVDLMIKHLDEKGGIIFFEDHIRTVENMEFIKDLPHFIEGDKVYYHLDNSNKNDLKLIDKIVKFSADFWPGLIGAITNIKKDEFSKLKEGKLNNELFKKISQSTEKIILGAYDGEGYLIWEKSPEEVK